MLGDLLGITKSAVTGHIIRAREANQIMVQLPVNKKAKRRRGTLETVRLMPMIVMEEEPGHKLVGCAFIFGDPGVNPWHYCNEPKERGSYCAEHYHLCHVPLVKK
jgi:hypothetical protein